MKVKLIFLSIVAASSLYSCSNSGNANNSSVIYKGVYSLGPQEKSFKECETGNEFWANDRSGDSLEAKYARLNFEKPYAPVYVEVQGEKMKTTKADTLDPHYDSIIVVKKVIKITKVIPQDMCN